MLPTLIFLLRYMRKHTPKAEKCQPKPVNNPEKIKQKATGGTFWYKNAYHNKE
jgi:hypothetical protein